MLIWFLALLAIIGVALAMGISLFFGEEIDYRQNDADILNYKIQNCLLNNEIDFSLEEDKIKEQFYSLCNLNQEVIEKKLLILLEVNNIEKLKSGRGDKTQCSLAEKNKNYPRCQTSLLNINQESITITTGSNQFKEDKFT